MEANELIMPIVALGLGIVIGYVLIPRPGEMYEPLYVPTCEVY